MSTSPCISSSGTTLNLLACLNYMASLPSQLLGNNFNIPFKLGFCSQSAVLCFFADGQIVLGLWGDIIMLIGGICLRIFVRLTNSAHRQL